MIDALSLRYVLKVPRGGADTTPRPMVVLIHGRGADANDLADLAPLLDTREGCRFVFPNAPRPFEPAPGMTFGWTWFDGWPPEQKSVEASRAILLRFLDEITGLYPTTHLVVAGFSQGAMMAFDVGLRTSRDVAGIIGMSGGLYETELPDLAGHAKMPVLIAHGSIDEVVSVNYARRARSILEDAGYPVEYHEYEMGHQVVMEEAGVVRDFLAKVSRSS